MPITDWIAQVDSKISEVVDPIAQTLSDLIFFAIPVSEEVSIPILVVWLVFGSLFFTFYFKFLNLRALKETYQTLRGRWATPNAEGEISSFQALTTAVSGTVGLGNIAGVAVAIATGGPGAAFWMTLAGFIGMSTKFIECTLGVHYRERIHDNHIAGGPMYYLSKGLAEIKGLAGLGKGLAVAYSIMCLCGVLGGGNMLQANQSYQQLVNVTGGDLSFFADKAWLFGLILAFFTGLVIIGGIQQIARVTEKIVPFMGALYLGSGLIIVLSHLPQLLPALGIILEQAFNPQGVAGGVIGSMIVGFRRSAFSSEVGVGLTAIAHASVKTEEPVSEGFVAMLEPFIDTILICNTTALVIVITNSHLINDISGVTLTSAAFESVIPWFPYLLSAAVLLFAFSTLISYSYYGVRNWCYLFGESNRTELVFKIIFLLFIVIGSTMQLKAVINFSDAMFFAMTFVNFIGLYIMAPRVKGWLKAFNEKYRSKTA